MCNFVYLRKPHPTHSTLQKSTLKTKISLTSHLLFLILRYISSQYGEREEMGVRCGNFYFLGLFVFLFSCNVGCVGWVFYIGKHCCACWTCVTLLLLCVRLCSSRTHAQNFVVVFCCCVRVHPQQGRS